MISSPAGRLVHASINGITSSYVYRADGLRASKSVNGQSTRFHYDFANRLIAESDASGTIREYLWAKSQIRNPGWSLMAGGLISRLRGDIWRVTRSGWRVGSILTHTSMPIHSPSSILTDEREAYWKVEAKQNFYKYNPIDIERMKTGRAPIGPDGHSMELHHIDRTQNGGLTPMSRTDHRLGGNFKKNHP